MRRFWPIALVTACHPGRDLGQLSVGGVSREYVVYAPRGLPDGPVPLVLVFHGTSGSAMEFYYGSGWRDQADQLKDSTGLIVAFLQGQTYCYDDGTGPRLTARWNVPGTQQDLRPWGACRRGETASASAHGPEVDDIGYVEAVVERLEADYPVDPDRVYLAGFSNGGAMVAYAVQAIGSRSFAAAQAAGGSPNYDYGLADRPVPVLHTLGSVDFHYDDGGTIPVDQKALQQATVAEVVDTFAAVMGVRDVPDRYLRDAVPQDGDEPTATFVYETSVDGGPAAAPYTFSVLGGLGHYYPPMGPETVEGGASFDMPTISWDFFDGKTRPQ